MKETTCPICDRVLTRENVLRVERDGDTLYTDWECPHCGSVKTTMTDAPAENDGWGSLPSLDGNDWGSLPSL